MHLLCLSYLLCLFEHTHKTASHTENEKPKKCNRKRHKRVTEDRGLKHSKATLYLNKGCYNLKETLLLTQI